MAKRLVPLAAALVVALLVGAGEVSASALCTEAANPCPEGRRYLLGTAVKAKQKAVFKIEAGAIGNVECLKSSLEGATTANWGAPLTGEVNAFTAAECSLKPPMGANVPCTATTVGLNWVMTIDGTPGGNGTVRFKKHIGGADPGLTVVCGLVLNCTFSKAEWAWTGTGGNPATLSSGVMAINGAGLTCPAAPNLVAEYEVTAPKPVFFVKEP